jgi:hypothetical protein
MVTMKKSVTMEAVKSLLLEWDGDGSGLEAVETAGGTLYKVADVIVQNEDIPGMTVTDSEGKETLVTDSIYNDMISRSLVGEGFAAKVAGYVYLAQKAAQAPGAKLPAGGIWLLKKQDGSYPQKVVLPAYREAFLQGEKPDGEKGESMGGGVTSWNDLKDRPFGETTVTVMEEQTVVFTDDGADKMLSYGGTFIPGKTYTVIVNGVSYDTLCVDAGALGSEPGLYALGNLGNFGLEDTGEPFAIMAQNGMANFLPFENGSYTISIIGIGIKPLDPKFLPEGVGGGGDYDVLFELVEGSYTGVSLVKGDYSVLKNAIENRKKIFCGCCLGNQLCDAFRMTIMDSGDCHVEFTMDLPNQDDAVIELYVTANNEVIWD